MSAQLPDSAGRYTKKPVTITAIQWDGAEEQGRQIVRWIESVNGLGSALYAEASPDTKIYDTVIKHPQHLFIGTLEGTMKALPGYWIIQGVKGEFYPCDPEIFLQSYMPADGAGILIMPPELPVLHPNLLPEHVSPEEVWGTEDGASSFQLSRHPYAENSFVIDHFTGSLLVSRADLEEAYRQLDAFLYPNPGYEPKIAEGNRG